MRFVRRVVRESLLIAAFVAALAAPAAAQELLVAEVGYPANLRLGPGIGYRIVAVVPAGSVVEVEACEEGWCYVFWEDEEGFVSEALLRFAGEAAFADGDEYPEYGYYYDHTDLYDYYFVYYVESPIVIHHYYVFFQKRPGRRCWRHYHSAWRDGRNARWNWREHWRNHRDLPRTADVRGERRNGRGAREDWLRRRDAALIRAVNNEPQSARRRTQEERRNALARLPEQFDRRVRPAERNLPVERSPEQPDRRVRPAERNLPVVPDIRQPPPDRAPVIRTRQDPDAGNPPPQRRLPGDNPIARRLPAEPRTLPAPEVRRTPDVRIDGIQPRPIRSMPPDVQGPSVQPREVHRPPSGPRVHSFRPEPQIQRRFEPQMQPRRLEPQVQSRRAEPQIQQHRIEPQLQRRSEPPVQRRVEHRGGSHGNGERDGGRRF